ncbi:ATP-grasp domain-containing protein [Algoriphagus taiwanensis]|uniref:ATP-grasp domain protein n=1 Tax=Algoriphagus taiwanensis TaxID=1445656 RepID=A0ABQ6PWW3_9BACT|nr:ATP-grasp domain protein [Algoriphagus taiwanensis]
MPACAFLSISNTEGWFIDDDLVHPYLEELGWTVQNIPWNQDTDWNRFDLVVIRSPWDYQNHLTEFLRVLYKINQSNAILLNSLELVHWNVNKSYLFELESKGVELVPTIKPSFLQLADIRNAFEVFQTDELIVKPQIGANADDTFRIKKSDEASWTIVLPFFKNKVGMLQPFMNSVVEEGEFSLMYFNGKLSHTILKTVGKGDFRVQEEHGGGVIPISKPEEGLLKAAEKAMAALPQPPFYARVDLVRTTKNTFALMELELIEPCLYFRFDPDSPKVFAELLDEFWRKNQAHTNLPHATNHPS